MKLLPKSREERTIIEDIVLIAVVALFSIGWFRGNNLIKTGDDIFPINPQSSLQIGSYIWVHVVSTGSVGNTFGLSFLPFFLFLTALQKIGIDAITSEKIFYYLSFALSGVFAYLLAREILPVKNKRIAALVSALFYMMNPFSLSIVWWGHYTAWFFSYVSVPLILFLCTKGVEHKNNIKYAFLVAISQFFLMPIYASPPVCFTILLTVLSYFLFYFLTNLDRKQKIIPAIKFGILTVILILLFDAWFILPNLLYFKEYYSAATSAYESIGGSTAVFLSGSLSSTMVNSVRLLGFYFVYANWYPVPVYSWAQVYSTSIFRLITFLIPILAFGAVLLKPTNKYTIYLAILTLIGLFLAKGAASPFGDLNTWFLRNSPYGDAFRGHFEKLGVIVCIGYALLIGIFSSEFYSKLRNIANRSSNHLLKKCGFLSILLTLVALMVVLNYPFFNGEVIYPGSQYLPPANIQIPEYYSDSAGFISQHPQEFRILDIPPRSGPSAYNWTPGYFASDPIDQYYYPNSGILGIGRISEYENELNVMFKEGYSASEIEKTLSFLNVKYILVHRDWNSKLVSWYEPGPELATKILDENSKPLSFGGLDFYEIPDEYFLPHIYTTTTPIQVSGNISKMFQLITSKGYGAGSNAIFLSNQTNEEKWQFLQKYNRTIFIDKKKIADIPAYNGSRDPFSWNNLSINSIEARYYAGWKPVIKTDGKMPEDTLSFPSLTECPYKFPPFSEGQWNALDSTLIYIRTGSTPLRIDDVLENEQPIKDIHGVWWENNWTGMMTKPIGFPIIIPENQKAIIQINHIINGSITFYALNIQDLSRINENKPTLPEITFTRINPTKYQVNVKSAPQPFFLVFSESYDTQWRAYSEDKIIELNEVIADYNGMNVKEARHETSFTPEDVSYLFSNPLDEKYHFTVNGYANAWYIDPKTIDKDGDGNFVITLYFWPQSLQYLGLIISAMAVLTCFVALIAKKLLTARVDEIEV